MVVSEVVVMVGGGGYELYLYNHIAFFYSLQFLWII